MYEMERNKKKRSPNFTYEEKENLLALVSKFQNVLDCKRTGAFYIQKKKEAWVAITKQYNSLCTTGPRDEEMLKHFYNNIKHRARKISASENKQRYLKESSVNSELVLRDDVNDQSKDKLIGESSLIATTSDDNDQSDDKLIGESSLIATTSDDNAIIFDENSIKDLKRMWADDKKNINKTGGGSYNPILTDADHQVLAILDDQIRPDENPFDEAAEYFKDPVHSQANTVPEPKSNLSNELHRMKAKKKTKKNEGNECIKKSAEMLKKIYFKRKIELAFYQKKNEILKFRNEQKRHEIQMQILKMQLEKAKRELM